MKHPLAVARCLALAAVCAAILAGTAGASGAVGDLRVLVIRATWGPTPDTPTLADVAPFYSRASFGQLRLHLDVTPWLLVYSSSVCPDDQQAAKAAAGAAGYDVASYARIAVLLPDEDACGFRGVVRGNEILLTYAQSLVHELGHTFGLAHATSYICGHLGCKHIDEYGDPLSPMGHGTLDFSAYEKLKLGWISAVQRVAGSRAYEIADIDTPSTEPQALVVPTHAGQYWIEHRSDTPRRVIVRLVKARTIYLGEPNDRFLAPKLFSVTRDFTFKWLDRQRPTKPQVHLLDQAVLWWHASSDLGSGIAAYDVTLDGKPFATTTQLRVGLPELDGRHRVGVVAVDRAGNRSRPGVALLNGI